MSRRVLGWTLGVILMVTTECMLLTGWKDFQSMRKLVLIDRPILLGKDYKECLGWATLNGWTSSDDPYPVVVLRSRPCIDIVNQEAGR